MKFLLNIVGMVIWAYADELIIWLKSLAKESWLYLAEKPKPEIRQPITDHRVYYDPEAFKRRPEPEPETNLCIDPDDKEPEDLPPIFSAFLRAFQSSQ